MIKIMNDKDDEDEYNDKYNDENYKIEVKEK
jgi:hypothetical protein